MSFEGRMMPYDEAYPDGVDGSAASDAGRRDIANVRGTVLEPAPSQLGSAGTNEQGTSPPGSSSASCADHVIRFQTGAQLRTRQARWVWPGRMPAGTVVIVEGDPDCAKSTIAGTILAALSIGKRLPDTRDDALPAFEGPVSVGYITGEDAPETTNLPRFLAAGGDPDRIAFYKDVRVQVDSETELSELLTLPRHLGALRDWIEALDLKAIVIDVLSSFTGEQIDSHNDASVRRMLTPLTEIAEMTGCVIIVIRHLTKGRGAKAIYAGQGSIAYGAAARSVLTAASHPSDPDAFVLAVTKGNLAPKEWRTTLAYRLLSVPFVFDDDTDGTVAQVEWLGTVDITADEAVNPTSEEDRTALEDAVEWLADVLADGPVNAKTVEQQAKSAGHSFATIRRAKKPLKVKSQKFGAPGETQEWKWVLPEGAHDTPKMPKDES